MPNEQDNTPVRPVTKPELLWPGKYEADGSRKPIPRVQLPFQVIESINESRTTREARKKPQQSTLFETYEGKEGDTVEDGWRSKLVWGDNLLVLSSLQERFGGKLDLVYIDPPFAVGADFSFKAQVGDGGEELEKEQSIVEEKAYRDTWGGGLASYLDMLAQRLRLIWPLLKADGNLFIHIGPNVSHYVRAMCDSEFGEEHFQNEIVWQRHDPHNDAKFKLGVITDRILWYGRSKKPYYDSDIEREELSESAEKEFSLLELPDGTVVNWKGNEHKKGRRFKLDDATWKGSNASKRFAWRGATPSPKREWIYDKKGMDEALERGELYLRDPQKGAARCRKRYLDENKGIYLQDLWDGVGRMKGGSDYPTQKPERLLERIISIASRPGGLVADFFSGSGTTLVVAEQLGRRWIGSDLSRWGIHVARKRLLELEECHPFEVLNLGRYERQYWQTTTFSHGRAEEQLLFEYLSFVLKLYQAQPIAGYSQIHGKKGGALIHVGAVDAPVTIHEISEALDETVRMKHGELHVLGWEWEMGLYDLIVDEASKRGVKLHLLQIPREVMEKQAVERGDVKFFELAYLDVGITKPKKLTISVSLKDFAIPNTELIPPEIRAKVSSWADFVDYWAIDWDFQNDTFVQGFVAYRTRTDRTLVLESDAHVYAKPGKYRMVVKVIDIFGNDTSQAFDVEVK
jgi:DNA modification methylase